MNPLCRSECGTNIGQKPTRTKAHRGADKSPHFLYERDDEAWRPGLVTA